MEVYAASDHAARISSLLLTPHPPPPTPQKLEEKVDKVWFAAALPRGLTMPCESWNDKSQGWN